MRAEPRGAQAPETVLVVDDDRLMRTLAQDCLEAAGYEVVTASDGREGVEAFASLRPDLVTLDLHMPVMDGLEACRELRRRHPGDPTPILMMTSAEDRSSIDAAYEAGATDFVAKPLNPDLLAYRVRYLLRASRAVHALRHSEQLLAEAQRLARLGSWSWRPATDELHWSEEACRILGFDPGRTIADVDLFEARIHPDDRVATLARLEDAAQTGKGFSFEHRLLLPDGGVRTVHQRGEPSTGPSGDGWISGTLQDVTEQVEAQARIRHLANYDSLTGLPNRRMFRDRLDRAIAAARSRGHKVALLFTDLDRFKLVNDTLGHRAGDQLLRTVSERFCWHVRGSDLVGRLQSDDTPPEVSRLGGDEFTILLSKISSADDAGDVARRLLDAVSEPILIDGHPVHVGVSIGIAVFPMDGGDAEAIMKNADAAMYEAKERGRNGFAFFSHAINAATTRKMVLQSRLRDAVERGELHLHYQPRVACATGEVTSVEALLRWEHPELGHVAPSEFIPLSEECGLILPIGDWVMRAACSQHVAWDAPGLCQAEISVNVSARQFERADVVALVRGALAATGLEPRRLEIEITESVLMRDLDAVVRTLGELRELGVRIALDDFGTGHSSLRYLKTLPIDTLKIDQSFVSSIDQDPKAEGIVRSIVALAHGLGLRVVSEGVETEAQARALQAAGCHDMQGFLFSRPVPAPQLERWLCERS